MATRSVPVITKTRKQVKERRKAGPKVRTGCITCKIRRVKCDETKPFCLRCRNFGTVCDGYAVKQPIKASRTSTVIRRPILPIVPKKLATDTILPMPTPSGFENEQEYRYFRLFCERTATSLAGYFVPSLWNRIILQACEDMPPIRHAIIALGALDKTLDITQSTEGRRSLFLSGKASEGATHHRFALQQYGKAITQMRSTLSAEAQDYRAALILCLLTICFEALNGDMQSAQEQIRNGLKIIKEWRESRTASALSSSSRSSGNKEIMRAFSCLNNNSMMIMNAIPVADTDDEHGNEHMLEPFSSLEDARAHIEMLTGRMLRWVASAYAWGAQEKDEAKRRNRPSPDSSGEETKPIDFRKVLDQQRLKFIEDFRNSRAAFQPLWLESQQMKGSKNYMTALSVELRFKAMYTSLLGDHFKGDTVYDAFTAEFREIIELSKILVQQEKLQSESQRANFTFDDPLIGSVYFVILKCRDSSLRREAIALLKSHPRRDNVMDSALMAKIATLQMNIEESGSEGNHIPEHARIRGIKTTTDMVKRTGQMKYLQMASSVNREFVVHHLAFTW